MAMKINKYHGKYNISARHTAVKYIVVHYTGSGSSKAGSALANCRYFSRGDRQASAHYFIDDSGIWEYADPDVYYTWHCGDGHGKYGITNANSVGVEVCMDGDHPYTAKEIGFLKELVLDLMKRYNIPASHVVRHFDASRKMCPYYYAKRPAEWTALRDKITSASSAVSKPVATKPAQTITQVAQDVINGKYGNGDARKAKLKSLGYDYDTVQKEVNRILVGKASSSAKPAAKAKKGYTGAWPTLPKKGYISKGDRGPETRKLQGFLKWYGVYTDTIDGSCGPNTYAAIKAFQKKEGLTVDGWFGPACLKRAKAVKK